MQLKNYLNEYYLQTCLKCGSWWIQDSLFCEFCYQDLKNNYGSDHLRSLSWPVSTKYFFKWDPQKSDSLSARFHFLKGSKRKSAWRFFAEEFWQAYMRSENFQIKSGSLLVPSPSRNIHKQDHAFIFCEALSEVSGIPMQTPLVRGPQENAQKTKSRRERRKVSMNLRENVSPGRLKDQHVILVDDILTTGGTALSARSCFLSMKSFETWVLAYRSLG